MIETIVLNHLKNSDLSVGNNVFLEVPQKPPRKYVVFEKTGSGKTNHLNRATMAVQSISKDSLAEAADLNFEVLSAMENLVTDVSVFCSDLNSDYNFTNAETKEYRYQAVFDVYYQE